MTTISSLSSITAKTGIGGLVSGMDIDDLVKSLTATSRQKILLQQQKVQKLEWKQTAYRSVTTALSEFQSSYLDVLSSTNFRSTSFFNTVKATSSSPEVSVASTSSASAGTITINSISQLATSQRISNNEPASKALTGTLGSDLLASIADKSISVTLDGKVKTLTFDSTFIDNANVYGLEQAFQAAVDMAFGGSNPEDRIIQASVVGDELTLAAEGSQITVRAVGDDTETLNKLGFTNGQSNKLSLSSPLNLASFAVDVNEETDTFKFSINSVDFEFDKEESLSTIMNKINASKADVTLSYSSITDSFTMVAKNTGTGENINIQETDGNLMTALGLTPESGATVVYGKNALLTVNGKEIIRSSNDINIDGVNIKLLQTTEAGAKPITISLDEDSSSLIDPIKKFVEDYNTMIDLINSLTKESVFSGFPPLSDEQRDDMSETEIEKWEEKAKSGLLRGDSILRGIASKLQTVMMGSAKSGGISLYDMGITSAGYQENGKLKIDESKLTEALKTKGSEISELFTSPERGLSNKINDVINTAIKKSGVKNQRGSLVDMAGIESSTSATENNISDTIKRTNKLITSLQARLVAEEQRQWRKFTAMETALQRMNEQSAILTQFMMN